MRKVSAVSGLFAGLMMLVLPVASSAGISISIRIAPPVLRVYQQPLCPTEGYLWTPGYWAYGGAGYYWVPGAWMAPPQVGFLWTPGYWGYSDGLYAFNAGYWGPTVGFYGGVNYGFGYGGSGFDGGRWQGGHFAYNTAVSHVNTSVIHNTYNQAVANHGNNRTSFNGGPGGISARPTSQEAAAAQAHHSAPVQMAHQQAAPPRANAVAQNRPAAHPAEPRSASAPPLPGQNVRKPVRRRSNMRSRLVPLRSNNTRRLVPPRNSMRSRPTPLRNSMRRQGQRKRKNESSLTTAGSSRRRGRWHCHPPPRGARFH